MKTLEEKYIPKIGDKVVFLGYTIENNPMLNGAKFTPDPALTKFKTYTIVKEIQNGVLEKIHLWLRNDNDSLGGYPPSYDGGYYNFYPLKEIRKMKLQNLFLST